MRKKNPDYLLVLIWSFRKEVIQQEIDFLKKTNATLKLGIYFKGWKDGEDEYYNPIDGSVTSSENLDVSIYQMHLWKYPIDESSICGFLNRRNKTTFNNHIHII